MKILIMVMFFCMSVFGAKNLSPGSEIRCVVTDGSNIDYCVLKSVMGSDDDASFGSRLSYNIPLTAGQLTALSAILSAGIAETKSQKSIP